MLSRCTAVSGVVRKLRQNMRHRDSQEFVNSVVTWCRSRGREFPSRRTGDTVHMHIAGVLQRRTQARRVVYPYAHLTRMDPDRESFSRVHVDDLRFWFKPLGFTGRPDSLVDYARRLVRDCRGEVPANFRDLQSLPGIGRYSARAMLCMAFNRSVPMIDGGSGRVL